VWTLGLRPFSGMPTAGPAVTAANGMAM